MASILDNPDQAEETLLALLQNRTESLLPHGQDTPKDLVHYGQHWLKLVGEEIRDEVSEGLLKRQRGMECTITVLGPVKDSPRDAQWLTVKTKEVKEEDDEATPDPPTMHMLFLSAEQEVIFYISGYQPDRRGEKFRALAFDVEALRQAKVKAPRDLPRGKTRCVELASASTALGRVHALCNVKKLDPSLAAALTSGGTAATISPWRPLDNSDPSIKREIDRLNPGQRAALAGLDGAVSVVQGPPGTGKSSFITAACLTRVPAGSRILACTATNKAIDSLVAKLESAGLTDMLCVGSRRAMGEASCRYLMSSVLSREPKLAEAEEAHEVHATNAKAIERELRELPKLVPLPTVPPLPASDLAKASGGKGGRGGKGGAKRGRGKGGRGGRGGGKGERTSERSSANSDETETADLTDADALGTAAVQAPEAGRAAEAGPEAGAPPPAPELSPEEKAAAEAAAAAADAAAREAHAKATAELKLATATNKKIEARRAEVKGRLKKEQELARQNTKLAEDLKANARKRVWHSVKVVACTASAALQVSRRLQRDMDDEGGANDKRGGGREAAQPLTFEFVILDEAAAMLEPDAIGCLLHSAKAALLVGDQLQLPPFSKWRDADTARYTVSMMARLAGAAAAKEANSPLIPRRGVPKAIAAAEIPATAATATATPAVAGKGGGKGNKGGAVASGAGAAAAPASSPPTVTLPQFMLTEQYRMHPAINQIVSSTFYFSKLKTAAVTAKQRQHPMPTIFVNQNNGREEFLDRSCFNKVEAECIVQLVLHTVHYLGVAPQRINVLTFYNAQRDLLEKMLAREKLEEAMVVSVDSMQGRESDIIFLSCVRADDKAGLGFVADAKRVNVALSRAKESLIVVGCARCLEVERIWRSALKGLQKFQSVKECTEAIEATLPKGWGKPRQDFSMGRDPKAERSSADREWDDEPSSPKKGLVEKLEQRDSGIPDDWDASDDDDEDDVAGGGGLHEGLGQGLGLDPAPDNWDASDDEEDESK